MNNYAAICAFPCSLNSGMLSVDLAVTTFFRKHLPQARLTLCNAEEPVDIRFRNYRLVHELYRSPEQLRGYDRILFWGDFLHWQPYAAADWTGRVRVRYPEITQQQAIDLWYKLFLLESESALLHEKTLIFGSTLYGSNGEEWGDTRYREALTALYRSAPLVLQRDALSAAFVDTITESSRSALGCDCALLLDADDALPMQWAAESIRAELPERYVACGLGRSGHQGELLSFANTVARECKLPLVNIDWLHSLYGLDALAGRIALIRRAELVITDIYHMSVTAWREKVTVIGIGKAVSYGRTTLDDKKKEVFFRQIMASHLYCYVEDILRARDDRQLSGDLAARLVAAADEERTRGAVTDFIARQIAHAETRLLSALTDGVVVQSDAAAAITPPPGS